MRYLTAVQAAAVTLYHNNAEKLATTSTGIDVTGSVTADGLTVGSSSVVADVTTGGSTPFFKVKRGTTSQANLVASFHNDNDAGIDVHGNGDISFYSSDGSSQALFWDSSAESLGIGTTSPAQPVEILKTSAGAVVPMIQLRNGSPSAGSGTSIKFMHSTVSNATSGTCELESIRYSGNLGALTFKTSNNGGTVTERMRVDDAGVGIGTSPNVALEVDGGTANGSIARFHNENARYLEISAESDGTYDDAITVFKKNTSVGQYAFRNSTTEYMRLDASGNLLVGKTAAGFANTGHELRGGGSYAAFTRDGGTPVLVNRKSSDGTLVEYMKDGTTVGSIGTLSGNSYIGTGDTGLLFAASVNSVLPHNTTTNAARDAEVDLGYSSGGTQRRFKDLYLSGGVRTDTTTGLSITADATNRGILNLSTSQSYQLLGGSHYGYTGYKTGGYHRWFGSDGGEDMRIDSSGNLLVGTNNASVGINNTDTGTAIGSDGYTAFSRTATADQSVLYVNKNTNDGKLVEFRKDGTAVGSIGVVSADRMFFSTADGLGIQLDKDNNRIVPVGADGSTFNNNVSLGSSGLEFKNLSLSGAISKGSGSFKIDHPLPEKTDTHHLVHSFVEAPQADNIYRGKVDLVDGSATVNIDDAAGMTEGTYVLLNTNTQCFTSNESGWTAVKGSVSGNTLAITAQDNTCTDTISWMVIGERHDQHMFDTSWTDENGKVIVEPLKES